MDGGGGGAGINTISRDTPVPIISLTFIPIV